MPCSYRIAQEGLPLLLPLITRQRLDLSAPDFVRLLTERSLPIPRADHPDPEPAAIAAAAPTAADAAAPAAIETAAQPSSAGSPAADTEPAVPVPVAAPEADASAQPAGAAATSSQAAPAHSHAVTTGGKPAPAKGGNEKPRGPPLDDENTLRQLRGIGNGCCVVTLRCGPKGFAKYVCAGGG